MIFIWLRRIIWFGLFIASLCLASGCFYYYHTQYALPDVETLKNISFETPLKIYTADNKLIAEFGEHRRIPLSIEKIPPQLKNAFLAIEDSRFYEHFGIDPVGIFRAAYVSLSKGSKSQGASTITQQVARNFFLSNEKTFTRKIKEIFLSWKIEQTLTKDEILELYLNKIALGHHSFGVAAASFVYFGKNVNELTLGEMAIIAGLPKAPSSLNPISNPKKAAARRHLVLGRMLDLGMITQQEYEEADKEPINAYYHTAKLDSYAPYVAESIRQKLEATYGDKIYTEGYHAYATIDSIKQEAANKAVFEGILDYDMRHGYHRPENLIENNIDISDAVKMDAYLARKMTFEYITPAIVTEVDTKSNIATIYIKKIGPKTITWENVKWAKPFKNDSYRGPAPRNIAEVLKVGDAIYIQEISPDNYALRQIPQVQSALISLNSETGAIMAMVGGYSFRQSSFNRVEQAKRQAGSNIKPFLYSSAMAHGYSLGTLMLDDKISIWNAGSKKFWAPKNSPNVYEGYIPVREALAKSKNVVSVRLVRAIGIDNFITHLKKFGFEISRYQRNDSLALGAYEVTPLELATGYATFSNGGYKIEPYLINKVTINIDNQEKTVYEANPFTACPTCVDSVENTIKPELIEAEVEKLQEEHHAQQIITHGNSFLIANALSSVIFGGVGPSGSYWGTGMRARSLNRSDISGKTGTTNQSRDAWFSGFNSKVVTTVWMGFDNFTRALGSGESGGKAALPIWIYYMKVALKDTPLAPVEPGETIVKNSMLGYPEYFIKDAQVMVNSPFIEETDFNTAPAGNSTEESLDDLF